MNNNIQNSLIASLMQSKGIHEIHILVESAKRM